MVSADHGCSGSMWWWVQNMNIVVVCSVGLHTAADVEAESVSQNQG